MFIKKIQLKNCLCFKDAWIPSKGEFGKINCFIGQNDRGKSLVLKIFDIIFNGIDGSLFEGFQSGGSKYKFDLNPMGINLINDNKIGIAEIRIFLGINNEEYNQFNKIISLLLTKFPILDRMRDLLIEYSIKYENELEGHFYIDKIWVGNYLEDKWILTDEFGGHKKEFQQILFEMFDKMGYILIPAIRKIDREIVTRVEKNWSPNPNGSGIANAIYEYINNPTLGKRSVINQLEQDLNIYTEFKEIKAFIDQNMRDLEYDERPQRFIGDATKQMTVSFFNIRNFNKKIIGYEEPESHLDPRRQKRLIKILKKLTKENDIQFFITTHSPFLIDQSDLQNIYHFKRTTNGIQSENVGTDEDLWNLLKTIGIRPHDFLQSDMVIFTEGPSDKLILEIFAKKLDYNLDELNITMQDIGGSLNNLDVDALLKINRNFRLILCSHVGNQQMVDIIQNIEKKFKEANQTSKLIILKKREIENYLSARVIEKEFKFKPNSIVINDESNVEMLVKNTSEIYGKIEHWGTKTKRGPKIASLMDVNEIDDDIKKLFEQIVKEIKENPDFPS
jgi:hypothetical protein